MRPSHSYAYGVPGPSTVDAVLIIAMTAVACLLVGVAVVWTRRELKAVWDAAREHEVLRAQRRNRRGP